MAEILASRGEGPPYQIGAGKKAWYRAESVDSWLLEEEKRQAEGRKGKPRIARHDATPFGQRRPRQRTTKMDRYLARQA